jgi:hypothetical protein
MSVPADAPLADAQTEMAVLGYYLVRGLDGFRAWPARAVDFTPGPRRATYEAMERLAARGEAIELPTVHAELAYDKLTPPISGVVLADYAEAATTSPGMLLDRLRDLTARRLLARACDWGRHAAHDGEQAADATIARLLADLAQLELVLDHETPGRAEADHVVLVPLDTVAPASVRWAWDGRIPLGAVSLLVGDGGLGKSTMLLDLAARLSRGQLAGALYGTPVQVAVATAEDAVAEVVRPRAQVAGADLARVQVLAVRRSGTPDGLIVPADLAALQAAIRAAQVRFICIDPLVAHLPETVNAHRDQDVRRALAPLVRVAEQEDIAVVAVVHLNKSESTKVVTRICASVGFHNAARSVLLVGPDPADRVGPTRVLVHAKCNLAPLAPALRFRIEGRELVTDGATITTSAIAWCGEATGVSSAEVLGTPDAEKESTLAEAVAWLRDALAVGPVEAGTLFELANAVGIAERTLQRARPRIGATTRKETFSGSWVWALAEGATQDATPSPMAPLAPSEPVNSPRRHRSSEDDKSANTHARAREAPSSDGDAPAPEGGTLDQAAPLDAEADREACPPAATGCTIEDVVTAFPGARIVAPTTDALVLLAQSKGLPCVALDGATILGTAHAWEVFAATASPTDRAEAQAYLEQLGGSREPGTEG